MNKNSTNYKSITEVVEVMLMGAAKGKQPGTPVEIAVPEGSTPEERKLRSVAFAMGLYAAWGGITLEMEAPSKAADTKRLQDLVKSIGA